MYVCRFFKALKVQNCRINNNIAINVHFQYFFEKEMIYLTENLLCIKLVICPYEKNETNSQTFNEP